MAKPGLRPKPANVRRLRDTGHRPIEAPVREPFDVGEGPVAMEAWLREHGLWRPHSRALLEDYVELLERTAETTAGFVHLVAERRRCLRDLGCLDEPPQPTAAGSDLLG